MKCPNKQGIWCPRCAARVVKEGQCSGRKGPGKGRRPVAARAPLLGPGREGGGFHQRLRPPLGLRRFQGYGPASWPVSRLAGAVLHARHSLPGPTRTPACMHGKRPVSRGEAHSAYNSGGDEAPFTSGVPHHTPPDLAVSAPLLSHTPTPVGSLVKGGD